MDAEIRKVGEPSPEQPGAGPVPVLVVENLSKDYDGKPAVRELSFDVGSGEILGLVGPNGAGKTTTLRSIVGILPVKPGAVRVCGFDIGGA